MRVWILGGGTLGVLIAAQLRRELHDVVVLEQDSDAANAVSRRVDCHVEVCDGTNLSALERLGTSTADCFIAVTGSDETNMVACRLVAQAFRIPKKIARVRSLKYANDVITDPQVFGIDHVINPEYTTAESIIRSLEHGAVGDVIGFRASSFSLRDIHVSPNGGLAGRRIADLRHGSPEPFICPIVARARDFLVADGATTLKAGDTCYVFSGPSGYRNLLDMNGEFEPVRHSRVLILGSSMIAVTVAQALSQPASTGGSKRPALLDRLLRYLSSRIDSRVTVVDPSTERCEDIARLLPRADIIASDIRDERSLKQSEIASHDVVIGATENEELNILGPLYAKSLGVKRAAAVIHHDGYTRIARSLGIDVPVNQKACVAGAISSLLRSGSVHSVHTIPGSLISAVELSVTPGSALIGVPLREANLPPNSLIMAITRNGSDIIPTGNDSVIAGDTVVLMTSVNHESALIRRLCPTER
ncbi:MAG: Trk system potassium transporter TrkA [Spirochaetaceae bacterium]|nr:MAG: Trk system potassium transporter TrkA [Spirochaetaceae bacterium]